MSRSRLLAIVLLAIGVTLLVAGAGFLYRDFTEREGAWADLQFRDAAPSDEERAAITEAWRDPSNAMWAFLLGAPGAGLSLAGILLAFFGRSTPETPRPDDLVGHSAH